MPGGEFFDVVLDGSRLATAPAILQALITPW